MFNRKVMRKEWIEGAVIEALSDILGNVELLTMIAAEAYAYYESQLKPDTSLIDGLEAELKDVEKALSNIMKAIESGIFNQTTQGRMLELEARQEALERSIAIEEEVALMFEDETSIAEYFMRFKNADLTDEKIRDDVFEYFIDKVFVYDNRLEITGWFTDGRYWSFPMEKISDDRYWVRWDSLNEMVFEPLALISTA